MVLGIYGASGLGSEFYELARVINEANARWSDIVYIDDAPEKAGTTLNDTPIMNLEAALATYGKNQIEFILAIGEPAVKDVVFQKLLDKQCEVTSLLHPEVRITKGVKMGKGILIHKGSGMPPNSVLGNNVLIQGITVMGHDLVLGDNVVISSLSFIGGDTTIGRNTYIAPHACIRNGLHIGENVIVGMGSVVTKDIPDNAVVYGNPAKIVRYNDKSRVFSK